MLSFDFLTSQTTHTLPPNARRVCRYVNCVSGRFFYGFFYTTRNEVKTAKVQIDFYFSIISYKILRRFFYVPQIAMFFPSPKPKMRGFFCIP